MKRIMEILELPPIRDNRTVGAVEVKIRRPGIIRQTNVMAKPMTSVSIVIPNKAAQGPTMELIPVVICEVDPDEKEILRRFRIAPPGTVIETGESTSLEFRGSFLYPQGAIMFLFEETGWSRE